MEGLRIYSDMLRSRLGLIVGWSRNGAKAQGVFFGELAEIEGELGWASPDARVPLPQAWWSRIVPTPPEMSEIVEEAPYMLEVALEELPPQLALQHLIDSGF